VYRGLTGASSDALCELCHACALSAPPLCCPSAFSPPAQCLVDVTIGFLSPVKSTLAVEVVSKGKLIRIAASVKALDSPGQKAVIWRGGPGVTKAHFTTGLLLPHKDNKKGVKFIDFNK